MLIASFWVSFIEIYALLKILRCGAILLLLVQIGSFSTLAPLQGEKILTFQTWHKKSLVFPSRGQGANLE